MSFEIDGVQPNERRLRPAEAVALCRFAKACCPQQQFDEFTPDAWGELLSDLRFDDCKEALMRVAKRQPFVAPAEIRAEVRRIRYDRLDKFGPFDPPESVGSGVQDYSRWLSAMNRRICDGELSREQYEAERAELTRREMPEIEGTFKRPDDAA